MSAVASGLARVKERIAAAELRAGRAEGSARLLAVSKRQPPELIREAYAAGQRAFGENYPQELRDKAAALADLSDLTWHAIGPLQSNKAKYVAAHAAVFHAADGLDAATELGRRRGDGSIEVFVSVNVAGEASKQGLSPGALPDALERLRAVPGLRVTGLMTLPPWGDPEAARPHFAALRRLAEAHGLRELSMGTTDDFEVAVEEGATWVRVGRSIFGERPT